MFTRRKFASVVVTIFFISLSHGGEPGGVPSPKEATSQKEMDWVDDRWSKTEVGQFLCATIDTPGRRTPKGIAIKVGDRDQGTVCFDTDTLRYVAGWTGGFLKLHPQRYGLIAAPSPQGEIRFSTKRISGWASNGAFGDPRAKGIGPLPKDWAHYRGLHLSGQRVVLRYTVGALEVLDSPWIEEAGGKLVFTRTIEVKGNGEAVLRICDSAGAVVNVSCAGKHELKRGDNGEIDLRLVAKGAIRATIAIGGEAAGEGGPLEPLTTGGPARWNPEIETKGVLGKEIGPFAIDTLSLPYANPWNALMFTSGHDFLPNGDAVVSTIHGDVWLVSGVDRGLRQVRWKRFATGLYQPLGVKVVNGKIFVIERDQITVLHDVNGDRETDFYENFNNDCISGGGGHSYAACLETDSRGNFYFLKCSEDTPHGGTVLRVDARGEKLNVVATGFRNPNGMGIGPDDVITVADQQGEWVPETRLDVIRPGGFYGFMPMHKRSVAPTSFEAPLCWIPRAIDNSAGGQVWIPDGEWGALGGQMIHLSYGRCAMMLILQDGVNGGVVPMPGRFLSGVMRGRFNERDDSLYLSGLRGWQTAAVRDGCFQRVRRTQVPLLSPIGFRLSARGLELTFDADLDTALAADASNFAAEQWNIQWSQKYGSPDFSARNPGKEGRDSLRIISATPRGRRTVTIEFDEPLRPVNVLKLAYTLETEKGEEIAGEFFCTINSL